MRSAIMAVTAWSLTIATGAKAQVIIDMSQAGSNVIMTLSGGIDTSGLTYSGSTTADGDGIVPGLNILFFNPPGISGVDAYTGFSGPSNFGYNIYTNASSGSGSIFAFDGSVLALPSGYLSGATLSAMEVFDETTIVGLGAIPGVYDYTWSGGFFQIDIGQDIPEPANLAVFMLSLGVVSFSRRRKVGMTMILQPQQRIGYVSCGCSLPFRAHRVVARADS